MSVTIKCKEIEGISNWNGQMEIEVDDLDISQLTKSELHCLARDYIDDEVLINILTDNGYKVEEDC